MGRTTVSPHDSPLGRWSRALYFPGPPLADYVEMFWYVAGRADFARDRRLPTGKTHGASAQSKYAAATLQFGLVVNSFAVS